MGKKKRNRLVNFLADCDYFPRLKTLNIKSGRLCLRCIMQR